MTKTCIGSATSEAPRAFSSGWPSKSADAQTRSGVIREHWPNRALSPQLRSSGNTRLPKPPGKDARAGERSAGRRGRPAGEHRGLPLERLLVAVEGIAVGQLAGVEEADMRPVGGPPDQHSH